MTATVVAITRCRHAFSGGVTTRVVGDVGADVTGHHSPSVVAL
jgi:hypothetical protein